MQHFLGTLNWVFVCVALPFSIFSACRACPCEVCPCYCPCTDRQTTRIAFVQDQDYSYVQPDKSWSRNGLQLYYGGKHAARHRGLQLFLYRQFNEKDARRLQREILDGSIHAVVSTLCHDMYMDTLLAAAARGVPVYIVGGTTGPLLTSLRRQVAAIHPSASSAAPRLLHLGVLAEDAARQLADRLIARGIQRVDCFYSNELNLAFRAQCAALEQAFQSAGLFGCTHLQSRAFVPMTLALTSLAAEMESALPHVHVNETALVFMDTAMYELARDIKLVKHVMEGGHVAIFEASPSALGDVLAGQPVTVLDRPLYSEAYFAVALASYQLQTGLSLTEDLLSSVRILSAGEVSSADVAREVCRGVGFPMCGDPGVPDVSPGGCACSNPSGSRLRVLVSVPSTTEMYTEVMAGLLDAQRDFAGTSFEWDTSASLAFNSNEATASVNASISQDDWTALLSLDHFLAPSDARFDAAMARLAASKGSRPYWFGMIRADQLPSVGDLLERYRADAYLGTSEAAWRSLGAYARRQIAAASGQDVLLYLPASFPPAWAGISHLFTDGFFNHSLAFPVDFWDYPAKGDLVNGTGVWSRFDDSWSPLLPTQFVAPAIDANSGSVDKSGRAGPSLVIRPIPPDASLSTFTEGLRALVQAAGPGLPRPYHAAVIMPVTSDDTPLALQVLQQVGGPNPMQLISARCTASDYQAFAYPESLSGGRQLAACLDWQVQLVTYVAYMLSVLHHRTQGELLLPGGELPTGRLVTRATATQRRADCLLYRREHNDHLSLSSFPVCDKSAGCGTNASLPCSGKGTCRFPSVEQNAKSGTGLLPSVGVCVCEGGHGGEFCELDEQVRDNAQLMRGLMLVSGLVLLALLLLATYRLYRRHKSTPLAQRKRKEVEERKKRPPAKNQPIAFVFTDIQGSTTLWEWDPTIMSQCVQIHHGVIRALLPKHHGYESNTEGDAFELVFHDASDALRWALETQLALMRPESVLSPTRGGSFPPLPLFWPEPLLTHPLAREETDAYGMTIHRGLRVRMGIHVGVPEDTYQHPNGRQRYLGGAVDIAKAIGDAPEQGGQVLMSMDAWVALDATVPMVGGAPVVVFNMGEHVLTHSMGADEQAMQLMTVLPQALLRRIPFRPLHSHRQLSPSFFEAPGNNFSAVEDLPSRHVAIAFTFIEAGTRLKAHPGYEASVRLLSSFARQLLPKHHGYECEEKNGNFLLAFGAAIDAALFSQELQAGAITLAWPESLLDHPGAAEVSLPTYIPAGAGVRDRYTEAPEGAKDKLLFRGLRLKIGFYWGIPTMCLPHASTGRAAYFGPLMNRAARIASTAASGQTLCNAEAVEAMQDAVLSTEPDLMFTPLGAVTLKGVSAPVALCQVSCSTTSGRSFPRLRAVCASRVPEEGAPVPGQRLSDEKEMWSPAETNRLLRRLPSIAIMPPLDGQGLDVPGERRSSSISATSMESELSASVVGGSSNTTMARWDVDLAIRFQSKWPAAPDKGSPKGGLSHRRRRGRMSLDSLLHGLDARLHAMGVIADQVLPLPSYGARTRQGNLARLPDEVYGDSPIAPVGSNPYLCAVAVPDPDDGTGSDLGGHELRPYDPPQPPGCSSPLAVGADTGAPAPLSLTIGQ